jgi:hypothetical protein
MQFTLWWDSDYSCRGYSDGGCWKGTTYLGFFVRVTPVCAPGFFSNFGIAPCSTCDAGRYSSAAGAAQASCTFMSRPPQRMHQDWPL